MNKISKTLFMVLPLVLMSQLVLAADDCPANVDPVYCKVAQETGGKVYAGKDLNKIATDPIVAPAKPSKHVHQYSPYSTDIGCDEWTDKRSHEICQSLSDNLEWGWTGHATIAPGWKTNWTTVKNVYCDQKITTADLPLLEKMCGSVINPYMSCTKVPDARLASGIEFLIKTIISLGQVPTELKGTIYDPENKDYLLKDGCRR